MVIGFLIEHITLKISFICLEDISLAFIYILIIYRKYLIKSHKKYFNFDTRKNVVVMTVH